MLIHFMRIVKAFECVVTDISTIQVLESSPIEQSTNTKKNEAADKQNKSPQEPRAKSTLASGDSESRGVNAKSVKQTNGSTRAFAADPCLSEIRTPLGKCRFARGSATLLFCFSASSYFFASVVCSFRELYSTCILETPVSTHSKH